MIALFVALPLALFQGVSEAKPERAHPGDVRNYPRFGSVVSGVGDMNKDGAPDFLIADPTRLHASVWAVSGKDWSVLHRVDGTSLDDGIAQIVRAAGDVDADGCADWIAGSVDAGPESAGHATVVSGREGRILHRFVGEAPGDLFGTTVDGAGDVDGDGHADLVIGARQSDARQVDGGCVYVFSGRDGSIIHRLAGKQRGGVFGQEVRRAGDVDRDGRADLLVLRAWLDGKERHELQILSGRDGSLLHASDYMGTRSRAPRVLGDLRLNENETPDVALVVAGRLELIILPEGKLLKRAEGVLADLFASLGDLDGDGADEFLMGDHTYAHDWGRLEVRSSGDGSIIYGVDGSGLWENDDDLIVHFGAGADAIGDVNGDGACDIVVGSDLSKAGPRSGRAWVFSGRDGRRLRTFRRDGEGIVSE